MTVETSENTIFVRFYFTLCYPMLTNLSVALESQVTKQLSHPENEAKIFATILVSAG